MEIQDLIEYIIKSIVNHSEDVEVEEKETEDKKSRLFMIAINDKIADGRDVSWLWNVDFSALKNIKMVSGIRAYDMALRLKYDNIKTDLVVEDLEAAVRKFANGSKKHKRIFATYTAMLEIRKIISGKSIL